MSILFVAVFDVIVVVVVFVVDVVVVVVIVVDFVLAIKVESSFFGNAKRDT